MLAPAKPAMKPKAKQKPVKSAAVITVFDADKMTAKGRKQIAAWLRKHADLLIEEGKNYAPRFRGRYLYS